MNKEMLSWDEALDKLLEKFELMETKRRQEEKIDKLLEMFELREKIEKESMQWRTNIMKEIATSIKATTNVFKTTSTPPPQAPPSPTPTTCSTEFPNGSSPSTTARSIYIDEGTAPTVVLELGDGEGKDHRPFIVSKDLPESTSTKCSTICFSSDSKPGLITAAVVSCAFTSLASMELEVGADATCTTDIDVPDRPKETHTKCSMVGLSVKCGVDQAVNTFLTMLSGYRSVPTSNETMGIFTPRVMAAFKQDTNMPTMCLLKCPNGNRKKLMERPKRNPWRPPWSGGVIRGRELRPSPWPGFNFCGAVEHLVPPWPPPTQPKLLTCPSNFGLAFIIDGVHIDWNLVAAVHKIAWSVMIKSARRVPSIRSELDGNQGKSTRILIDVDIHEGSAVRVTFVAIATKENIMVVLLWCVQNAGCNPRKSGSVTTETEVSHLFNSFSKLSDWHLANIELLVSKRSQEVCCLQGALELQVSVLFWLLARNINPPKFEVLEFLSRVFVDSLSEKYSGSAPCSYIALGDEFKTSSFAMVYCNIVNHSHKTIIVHLMIRNKLKTWISETTGRTDRVGAKFTIVCQLSRSLQFGTHILDLYSAEEHIHDNFHDAVMWCSVPIKNLPKQWDPGGIGKTCRLLLAVTSHRLGDKPNVKKGRLLGTQLGCLSAVNHSQSQAQASKWRALYKQQEQYKRNPSINQLAS